MADGSPARAEAADGSWSATASPLRPEKRQQEPGALGHSFKRVTLTKPTFCHHCSDFLWGLLGFLCEACNLMCHEKCLKRLRSLCSSMTPSAVRVPVAHCFGPDTHKRRICCVCRKQTEGNNALRCEVCELHVHADCAAFTCADCRFCHVDGTRQQQGMFQHHWREGNLASSSRCHLCRRSCSSSDGLAGMRCEWCGVTCHAACHLRVAPVCTLGRLRLMMLHPACVRLQSRNFSKHHCFRIVEGGRWRNEGMKSSFMTSHTDDSDDVTNVASKDGQPAAAEHGKQFLKVYDGDDALRRGHFRLVPIVRATKNQEVLEAALRAFYLPDDPQDVQLQEVGGLERVHSGDILNRNSGSLKGGGDSWMLRAKGGRAEVIRVYDGSGSSGPDHVSVSVSEDSTAASVLAEALEQLKLQKDDTTQWDLLEVVMSSKQVQKQTLMPQQNILAKLHDIRKTSLRQMNRTRFYVVERQNQAVRVRLLIGGLPPQLSKEQYWQLLQEQLAVKTHLADISHVYPSQGAVALQLSCFSEAERVFMLAKDVTVKEKSLTSLVIPEIQLSQLGEDVRPLLVFVNTKSGGLKGKELLYAFRKLLNPHQVFDLSNGGPLPGLHTFRDIPSFRVLACGGDGTVGWVLSVLEELRHQLVCREPPVGIVPLGTGNDLSRVLRWGTGYSGDDPSHMLACVDEADEVLMDRWTILLDAQELAENSADGRLEAPKIVHMNNYLGVGIDAELSLDFHQAREDDPEKFSSRFHNKGVYVKVGLQKISATRSLHRELQLHVDGRNVALPNIEGLIFLNIPSWGSGADLWGSEADCRYSKPSVNDGLLEAVGVTGVVHMVSGWPGAERPAFWHSHRPGNLHARGAQEGFPRAGGRGAVAAASRAHHHLRRWTQGAHAAKVQRQAREVAAGWRQGRALGKRGLLRGMLGKLGLLGRALGKLGLLRGMLGKLGLLGRALGKLGLLRGMLGKLGLLGRALGKLDSSRPK
ncbi:diacylglycerol kinase theta-like isoform X4 [Syngnathus acus]|uniref:diacylglycerol kinase theta-like isoform X4 n=1 Tax=Syngnathus acus TaxID=161584 RepID=UPI0018863047|nr:diacylglycerol kinase theta-like isoform X4 [Syngnathus acus]